MGTRKHRPPPPPPPWETLIVGKHFEFRVLDIFLRYYGFPSVQLPGCHGRLQLQELQAGTAMQLKSDTRWWSHWEVLNQVMQYFGDVVLFLRKKWQPLCHVSNEAVGVVWWPCHCWWFNHINLFKISTPSKCLEGHRVLGTELRGPYLHVCWNVAIYISSDYIVRQTIIHSIIRNRP